MRNPSPTLLPIAQDSVMALLYTERASTRHLLILADTRLKLRSIQDVLTILQCIYELKVLNFF